MTDAIKFWLAKDLVDLLWFVGIVAVFALYLGISTLRDSRRDGKR